MVALTRLDPKHPIAGDVWLNTNAVEELTEAIGVPLRAGNLKVMRSKGYGPKYTRMGAREVWYRWRDVREFLEARLGMSIREGIECGRLTIPPALAGAAWDADGLPVERKRESA